tara:strand:+ start:505 stop:840 length:336 start_codon:yes stop_codon:yes gene_type:complete
MKPQHLKKYDHLTTPLYEEFGEDYQGQPYVLDGEKNPSFRAHLLSLGVADTRVGDITVGLNAVWNSLCQLDYGNLHVVCKEFEGLASICKKFGEIEGMRCEFTDSKGEEYK